jgi:cell division protein FtsZ
MIELNRTHSELAGDPVKIKIAGVGGAGSNALDRLVLDGLEHGEMIAINTDVQALTSSVSPQKVQLGRQTTRGLGAGGDPELGLAAAEEAIEEIRHALDGASMIFVCAGLGGGTGSGAAPLVANLAKEQGSLVIAFATMPFSFEGKRRRQQAEESLLALQEWADAVVCFENDKMGDAVSPKAGIHQAFASADQTISQSVRAIVGLFTRPGLIHIGFDDLCSALRTSGGRCLFGFGEAEGDNRAHDALARALKSPLMDRGRMLAESETLLVNVTGGPSMTLNEVQILMDELNRHVSDSARILFGVAVDAKLAGRMSVAIISSVHAPMTVSARPAPVRAPLLESRPAAAEPARRSAPLQDAAVEESVSAAPEPEPESYEAEPMAPTATEETEIQAPSEFEPEPEPEAPPAPATHRRGPHKNGNGHANGNGKPHAAAAAGAALPVRPKSREERQETLQFEPVSRGRFEKSEPTIVDGQDLDVPTFLRRNLKIK